MPKICYIQKRFKKETLEIIEVANQIIEQYAAQGFDLTLRQLYYQFVSQDLIANTERSYKRLGSIVNDARLAGLIDWEHITDRTRNLQSNSHWSDPGNILEMAARQYLEDRWALQRNRVEVWIEKDALVGVIEGICSELDVPYFSCRGYTSQSEMWVAAQRLQKYADKGQTPHVIHLGDHDPSGIDMSRDIQDRLYMFMDDPAEVDRIALTWDQIETYDPPPNPAKITDSRADKYILAHGNHSWELDALDPTVLRSLIEDAVLARLDDSAWNEATEEQEKHRKVLENVSGSWQDLME